MRFSKYGNRGMVLEKMIEASNVVYGNRGIALVQKISTPVKVLKEYKGKVQGFYEKKSTLDFRGTIKPSISISFDCKESQDKRGLLLKNIKEHQLEYIKKALEVGEVTFILTYIKPLKEVYFIDGGNILRYYERWQKNKGKVGFNFIPVEAMKKVKGNNGIIVDYVKVILEDDRCD